MKVVHLKLGGKRCAIIFDDADLESVVSAYPEAVAEKFLALFKGNFSTAAVLENPPEPSTSNGPRVDGVQYERVKHYLSVGKNDGTLTMGGDEVFGPEVVVNIKLETEVLEKANCTEIGLRAFVFT
ncbi:uncharacterized protein ATNIH1004_008826 [Aspergillus tanneri]|uniref:Aldehyde dehydrogenase domain-containing protein n=1 Tax=Aspergillus tanneri TaxID=1220188 RepID=A0A5M9MGQ4_9EURO|nr:uncharacterized protein ATNIH1004_008826 [Aspergillus tanneri]KAA8644620.1 hypothetical protein ATNIH1004_008826 [Aspergillus tanneri]